MSAENKKLELIKKRLEEKFVEKQKQNKKLTKDRQRLEEFARFVLPPSGQASLIDAEGKIVESDILKKLYLEFSKQKGDTAKNQDDDDF